MPLVAQTPIGRIDGLIEPTAQLTQHKATGARHIIRKPACEGDNGCPLDENDSLDIENGSFTFTIIAPPGSKGLQWTCRNQRGIQIHAMNSTCKDGMVNIAFRNDATVGSAEWNTVYRAEESKPKSTSALILGGQMLEKAGRFDEAIAQYSAAKKILPQSSWIQHELDRMQALTGQLQAGPAPEARKFAVLIGVSKYFWHPALYLPSPASDALWLGSFLASTRGGGLKDPGGISELINEDATVSAIRREIRDALRMKARSGDTVVIYLSGHAVQRGQSAFLVGYDSRLEEPQTLYPLDELRQMSQDASRVGVHVVLFADVCHAGALEKLKKSGGVRIPAPLDGKYFGEGGVWGIAASGVNEFSLELAEDGQDGHFHGVFTRYLLEGLQQSPKQIFNSDVWSYVNDKMTNDKRLHNQHPIQIGPGAKAILLAEEGTQAPVPQREPGATTDVERFTESEPRARWAIVRGTSAEADFSASLERAGDTLLNEYLSGGEIPQTASEFRTGAEIYAVLSEIAPSGKVVQDRPSIESRRLFFEAMALVRAGKKSSASKAVTLLKDALEWNENAGYLYNALGQAYALDRQTKEAMAAFQDAILLDQDWAYPRHNLAVMKEAEAQDDEAAKLYDKAIERALAQGQIPASSRYNLGRLAHARNDFATARQHYRSAIKDFNTLGEMYRGLAAKCSGADCPSYARMVVSYRVGEAQTWNALGILEHDDHREAQALNDLEHGRDLLKELPEGRPVKSDIEFNLAKVKSLQRRDSVPQRMQALQAIVNADGTYAPAIFELALLQRRENACSEVAENGFKRVSDLEPDAIQGWLGLIEIQRARGRATEAEATLQRATEYLDPGDAGELRRALQPTALEPATVRCAP
jgi:tetratricopeptide (TPR) repeat protein